VPPTPTHPEIHPHAHRLLIAFGVVLALCTAATLVAAVAGLLGWYRIEMLTGAAGLGSAIALIAVLLLYRQSAQRRAADMALQNAEARVGGIIDSAMDPIITIDEEQRVVLFNQAAETVFRWPRAAVIGQSLDRLLPARFRGTHHRHIEHFGKTGVTTRRMGGPAILAGLRADGEEFPMEASISQHIENGKKLFTVILRDITERMQAKESLIRSEERLRGILDSAMDAIITVDERQHIVLFNNAAEQVFGCPRAEALGAPLSWFIPERFRAAHGEHIQRFGAAGTSSRRMGAQRIVTGLRRNGEEFPIDASISQISEHGNKFYTVILRDVTERVASEQALRHSKEELQHMALAAHSIREQEKSRIARELHDELGQALSALKMDVVWLREKAEKLDSASSKKLAAMETMLDQTVAATRRISSDLRPLMLDDLGLIPAAEWLVQNFTQRTGIACTLNISDPEPELHDPNATAVFRIVQESLTNIARHAQATHVEVSIVQAGGSVQVRVRDNGIGFAPDSPRKPGSHGLTGLRERAMLLGGTAKVTSAPGAGTTIEVSLPMASTEPQP